MRLQGIAPILPVKDVVAALRRYQQFGFEGTLYGEVNDVGQSFYGFLWRGVIRVHLALVSDLNPRANTSAVYLYVDDPDALFAEWRAASPDGELRQPQDTPWRMREMSYSDPDGNLPRIGSRGSNRGTDARGHVLPALRPMVASATL